MNIFVQEVQLTWEANVILCISGYGIDVKYYSCTFIISTVGAHTKLVLQMGYMCVVYLYQVILQMLTNPLLVEGNHLPLGPALFLQNLILNCPVQW